VGETNIIDKYVFRRIKDTRILYSNDRKYISFDYSILFNLIVKDKINLMVKFIHRVFISVESFESFKAS
jgi:hypothetical protein